MLKGVKVNDANSQMLATAHHEVGHVIMGWYHRCFPSEKGVYIGDGEFGEDESGRAHVGNVLPHFIYRYMAHTINSGYFIAHAMADLSTMQAGRVAEELFCSRVGMRCTLPPIEETLDFFLIEEIRYVEGPMREIPSCDEMRCAQYLWEIWQALHLGPERCEEEWYDWAAIEDEMPRLICRFNWSAFRTRKILELPECVAFAKQLAKRLVVDLSIDGDELADICRQSELPRISYRKTRTLGPKGHSTDSSEAD
jgi:hypothetical protein